MWNSKFKYPWIWLRYMYTRVVNVYCKSTINLSLQRVSGKEWSVRSISGCNPHRWIHCEARHIQECSPSTCNNSTTCIHIHFFTCCAAVTELWRALLNVLHMQCYSIHLGCNQPSSLHSILCHLCAA